MPETETSKRKKDHINICVTKDVGFKTKTNGFENYVFDHYALTEVDYDKIDLSTRFFTKKINLPFLISCMTGGTSEAEKINEKLAVAANELNIPIGVGSQRQALENKNFHSSYKTIRKNAGNVPVIGNIGAAQIVKSKNVVDEIKLLIDLVEADAMAVHFNPLQELLQKEGDKNFSNILKRIEKLTCKINTPFIAKEVGAGINEKAANKLLDAGIKGIDVAGAGGTSWAGVEILRNEDNANQEFWDWGLPTSYCLRKLGKIKSNKKFMLISSGGITDGSEIAKSIALGADLAAAARPVLISVINNDVNGVIELINEWFSSVKNIMYLTNCSKIGELKKVKLISKAELF